MCYTFIYLFISCYYIISEGAERVKFPEKTAGSVGNLGAPPEASAARPRVIAPSLFLSRFKSVNN